MDRECTLLAIHFTSVSTPNVVVTAPSSQLVAGSKTPINLTCTVSIDGTSDLPTTIIVTWSCGSGGRLLYNNRRITISDTEDTEPRFRSILSLSPLSTSDSDCIFTCRAIARPPPNFQSFSTKSAEVENSILLAVKGNHACS